MSHAWTRRQVLTLSGNALAAAGLAAIAPRVVAGDGAQTASHSSTGEPSADVYRKAFVLDANALASIGTLQYEDDTAALLEQIRGSGITAVKSTLGGPDGSFESTVADIAAAQALIDAHPDRLLKVVHHDDLERARRERKLAIIFSFEAASMLEGQLDRIDLFRHFGVLAMQLSYNRGSPFGAGCLDGDTGGITDLGRQAVARMNTLGVAVDLSHSNAQTTRDGIAVSGRPAVITHAGCRAVFDHPRNKLDRDMRALAEKGGVMGIYMLPFLTEDTRQPMLEDYMRHMVHALDVCGEDHVGIGTDSLFFRVSDDDLEAMDKVMAERMKSGIGAPGENRTPYIPDLNTPCKLERVADALTRRGYGERTTEKILGLNFQRVFKEIWTI